MGDAPPAATRISLNDRALDEVRIAMPRLTPHTVSSLSLPARWHHARGEGEVLLIETVALVVMQSYFEGVLAPGRGAHVQVKVGDGDPADMVLDAIESLDRDTIQDRVRLRFRRHAGGGGDPHR